MFINLDYYIKQALRHTDQLIIQTNQYLQYQLMSAPRQNEFRSSGNLIIDPNLGIVTHDDALNDQQYFIYVSRHLDKEKSFPRPDLLPFESHKFHRYLYNTEYFINSQRQKINKEVTRFSLFYTPYFCTTNLQPFLRTVIHSHTPFNQSMIFNYYRNKNDTSNLVNYLKRTLRRLSQYGMGEQPDGPFMYRHSSYDQKKKSIKDNLLKNSQKVMEKLLQRKQDANKNKL